MSTTYASKTAAIEVRGVGCEGMLGSGILATTENSRFNVTCQISGSMLFMTTSMFASHADRSASLKGVVSRYVVGVLAFMAQSVACNGLHNIAQRCARWLLITADRVGALEFLLTHELLAQTLGVRRSSVSVTVNRLQRLGIIRYRLGRISIIDKRRLELQSCECYRSVARKIERIGSAKG